MFFFGKSSFHLQLHNVMCFSTNTNSLFPQKTSDQVSDTIQDYHSRHHVHMTVIVIRVSRRTVRVSRPRHFQEYHSRHHDDITVNASGSPLKVLSSIRNIPQTHARHRWLEPERLRMCLTALRCGKTPVGEAQFCVNSRGLLDFQHVDQHADNWSHTNPDDTT